MFQSISKRPLTAKIKAKILHNPNHYIALILITMEDSELSVTNRLYIWKVILTQLFLNPN